MVGTAGHNEGGFVRAGVSDVGTTELVTSVVVGTFLPVPHVIPSIVNSPQPLDMTVNVSTNVSNEFAEEGFFSGWFFSGGFLNICVGQT